MNLRVHRKNDKHHWSLLTSTLGRDESSGQPSDSVQSVRVRILVRVVSLPALYHRLNFVFCSVLWSLFVCHCFLLLFVSVLWHLFILYLDVSEHCTVEASSVMLGAEVIPKVSHLSLLLSLLLFLWISSLLSLFWSFQNVDVIITDRFSRSDIPVDALPLRQVFFPQLYNNDFGFIMSLEF